MSGTELGVFLGLITAFSWAVAGMIHTSISRSIGIEALMLARLPLAVVVLGIACLASGELWLPSTNMLWLAGASGLLGIVIGDACFYTAALAIGLRATLVCLSLSACFTAVLGTIFLGEFIGAQGWLGMAIATVGVALVVITERGDGQTQLSKATKRRGVALALSSALFLAIGMIFSKRALDDGMSALQLSLYRNIISMLGVCLVAGLRGHIRPALAMLKSNPQTFKLFPLGCLFGSAGGIWLSCVTISLLPAAVASMLIGLEPIALLIIVGVMERRLPPTASMGGAVIACSGAAVLLLR